MLHSKDSSKSPQPVQFVHSFVHIFTQKAFNSVLSVVLKVCTDREKFTSRKAKVNSDIDAAIIN